MATRVNLNRCYLAYSHHHATGEGVTRHHCSCRNGYTGSIKVQAPRS